VEYVRQQPITIAVENMPRRRFGLGGWSVNPYLLNDLKHWGRLFPALTLDTTHLGTWGADILAVYEEIKERVAHVHLSNFNGAEHRLLDDGHLPLAALLRALMRDHYTGIVTTELDPEALHAEDEQVVRSHLARTVAFIREYVGS
jgi:sugar phosphate isomerase/epimerase